MAYEYERGIIGMLRGIENRHLIDLSDHKQELKEVYAKAKAQEAFNSHPNNLDLEREVVKVEVLGR